MMKRWWFPGVALVLTACTQGAYFWQGGDLQPKYHVAAHTPVITQTHTTGTVAPNYFHEDTLIVYGDGAWQADRSYPYTSPPTRSVLASGSLSGDRLQQLVNQAFQAPGPGQQRFVDLPARSDDRTIGGGQRSIALTLEAGTRSVSVNGRGPAAFEAFDQAIATATTPLNP